MTGVQTPPATAATRSRRAAEWYGLGGVLLLVLVAVVVPRVLGWQVASRSDPEHAVAPLHGTWDPTLFGPGTIPAMALAVLGWRYAIPLAERLPWRRLLVATYVAGLAWMVALAFVEGPEGVSRVLLHPYEYLETAREVDDVPGLLEGYVDRIDADHPDNWVTHVAGHPPLALMFFVGLVRVGLGGDLAAGIAVTVVAAGAAPAVLVTLRVLRVEWAARRAAPFLVLGPAAIFMAVSADAVFAAVSAWGLATLAIAATRSARASMAAWAALAGLLLGACVMLSYGLPLLAFLAVAVLVAARSWRPLPVAALTASAVVLGFAAAGFAWWEAYPELHERYWRGLAKERPAAYWMWGNLAALAICAGPMLGAGLARLGSLRARADRVVLLLAGAAALAIVAADLSRMSKAEVERIWLPFVPWLLIATALLPENWRRWGLGVQLVAALLLEHLLYTTW